MGINLRNALMASIAVHAAVLASLCDPAFHKEPAKKEMVVDYVTLKEPIKAQTPVADTELKIPETPKVELKPKVEAASAPAAPTANIESDRDLKRELAQRQAQARTTKDYINYYQLIREKIRQKAKRGYLDSYGEGEIRLKFTLSSKGALVACDIDRAIPAGGEKLAEIAMVSVRQASPFPPLPKGISLPEMSFDITIVFKKDR